MTTPYEVIERAVGSCLVLQRYRDQRHYEDARKPGIVVARLMADDPEYAEAVRSLRSDDIGPGVIRRDDPSLAGFGSADEDRWRMRQLLDEHDRKQRRR